MLELYFSDDDRSYLGTPKRGVRPVFQAGSPAAPVWVGPLVECLHWCPEALASWMPGTCQTE